MKVVFLVNSLINAQIIVINYLDIKEINAIFV